MNLHDERTTSDAAESANDPTGVYERDDDETATEAVVTALSSVAETPETELDPIYAAVDPDALDSLFGRRASGTPPDFEGHVVFRYDGYRVRVESDGTVLVCESE